jgi:peptidoglycan LD-endopeptidase LytH
MAVLAVTLTSSCVRSRVPAATTAAPSAAATPGNPPLAASARGPAFTPEGVPAVETSVLDDLDYVRGRRLGVPVAGVTARQLVDSFDEPRDGSRRHSAIDILAPRGTPILSADDGRVLRISRSIAGGNTVYAVDPQRRIVYYYAHLDRYRESLTVGMPLAKGDTIGFVGTTGNAPKDTPHLHFQVMRMPRDGKYWTGEPLNPFMLLRGF